MSREETKQILSELHEVSGVSGREYKVGEKMKELLIALVVMMNLQ